LKGGKQKQYEILAILFYFTENIAMNHTPPQPVTQSHHVALQNGGRVVIPAEYRKALGYDIGETLVIRMEGDEIRIYSLQQAVKRAQQLVAKYDKSKKSIVDELIAERHAAAELE